MNPLEKIKSWMHWRGITPRDIIYAVGALTFMGAVVVIMAIGIIGAWI